MFSFANIGMPAFITKFFPYYSAHVKPKENDQLTWALLIPVGGFIITAIATILLKDVLIDKMFNNSPGLPEYFLWIIPFGFGYTLFMVMEAYAWQRRKAVLSNFLKEVLFRFFITILVLCTTIGIIGSFDGFIKLYAFSYILILLIIMLYFYRKKQLHFSFSVSTVSKKFFKKIRALVYFVWPSGLIFTLANVFDTIVIVAVLPDGLAVVALFTLAQNITSLIQAPQRGVISASVGPLSQAWRAKDYDSIKRIYQRSSINQLLFSLLMFFLIWLNFEDAIDAFHLQEDYKYAKWIFFFLGLSRIVDMGTGVNAQIIGTSTYWRFEFISGIILLLLVLPLNFILTRYLGPVGPGIANLISFAVYNAIRAVFLWNKFRMQPFTANTFFAIALSAALYFIAYFLFNNLEGIWGIFLRSAFFSLVFVGLAWKLRLTPDIQPILISFRKRLRI
jgi:O-antigen/teichoic acid export membrane protein